MDPSTYKPSKEIQQLWRIELELADVLLEICNKNDLHIWAGYGTLIGAARHKGFIPWDNDLDFVMLRRDYDELLRLIRLNAFPLPSNCEFDLANMSIIKLRRTDTTMYSESYRLNNNLSHGVWIDVFCLDVAPDVIQKTEYSLLKNKIRIHHNASMGFFGSPKNINRFLIHCIVKFFFLFRNIDSFRESIENELRKTENESSGNKVWAFLIWSYIKNDVSKIAVHDRNSYNETIMMPFEDRLFPCPKDYDSLLTAQYGDWRTPIMGGSQHEGVHVDINKPYSEYIDETLKKMPSWKRYLYKH